MKLVKFVLLSLVFAMTSVWAAEYHGSWITNEVGNWKDGGFTGVATEEWPSGVKYIGEFKDGKHHGRGIKYSASGSVQESGIYKDNKLVTSQHIDPNSFIRITINNSVPADTGAQSKRKLTLYEDLYGLPSETGAIPKNQNNLLACQGSDISRWSNCIGTWTTSNGDKFIGKFINGKSNGWGFITDSKGNEYGYEYKDDKAEGPGAISFSNGDKYVGEFKDKKLNGQGILTKADGKRFEGIFEDNRFIREAKVNLPSLKTNIPDNTERNNLELERQRLAEERRRLEED